MKQKARALWAVTAMYAVAAAVGAGCAVLLADELHPILALFIADIAVTIVIYIFNLVLRNASVYDPYWSVIPPLLVLGYYLVWQMPFDFLHLLIIIPFLFWAVRLTLNWAVGFTDLKWEDWRYRQKREQTGRWFPLVNFVGIMMMPTVLTFAGTIPFYYILSAPSAEFVPLLIGGAVVSCAAVWQMIADLQMKKFLKSRKDTNACINGGLWLLCRHPNYLGEIMVWVGVFIASVYNFNWRSVIGCAAIMLLFVFISVPMMEKRMSGRASYADYKKRVRTVLLPISPMFVKK